MESCFHSGESSGCHQHGPLRGESDVQNCSSAALFQSQSATPSQIEQRRDDEGDARGRPLNTLFSPPASGIQIFPGGGALPPPPYLSPKMSRLKDLDPD